ncbi:MAG: response regulator [Litorimonas sp.]
MSDTAHPHDTAPRPRRVMIVEDDAFIALDVESVLETAGFEVIACATRVDEAMDVLDRTRPDFAVLDYNLGDETSISVARRLQAEGVPFMFLSGQSRDVVLSGMDGDPPVMGKPFQPRTLVSTARGLSG